jgi:hypothetical protein
MSQPIRFTSPVRRWSGSNGGSWFLVHATGEAAQEISGHALMRRLEEGRRRGFGSVKVEAQTGETRWTTSVFPQGPEEWVMLLKAEVRRAEGIGEGDEVEIALDLL